jgi:hypothetical protein
VGVNIGIVVAGLLGSAAKCREQDDKENFDEAQAHSDDEKRLQG